MANKNKCRKIDTKKIITIIKKIETIIEKQIAAH